MRETWRFAWPHHDCRLSARSHSSRSRSPLHPRHRSRSRHGRPPLHPRIRSSSSTRRTSVSKSTAWASTSQKMNDQVFSFGELGFQEFETTKYLTGILRKNGFTIKEAVAGIPTAWTATWGIRQACHRDGFGHRRHSGGVAEARRRLPRSDYRRRSWTRRGPQLGHAAADRRRAVGQEDHGAAASAGNAHALAWRCRRARSAPRRTTSARACSRMWTSACLRTWATT